MGSLQDALLKSGLAEDKSPRKAGRNRSDRADRARRRNSTPSVKKKPVRKGTGHNGKSDLEQAWAARRRAETLDKERAKQQRVADQEARRKRNLELDRIIEGQALNDENAGIPRYFQHLGKIRRVLCTPEQRDRINSGRLGVVNLRGGYFIVEPEVVAKWREIAADLVPDLAGAEPDVAEEGEYPPVPDDLSW